MWITGGTTFFLPKECSKLRHLTGISLLTSNKWYASWNWAGRRSQTWVADIYLRNILLHVNGQYLGLDLTWPSRGSQTQRETLVGRTILWKIGTNKWACPASETWHLSWGRICLELSCEIKQDEDRNHTIWKVPKMIAYLSKFYDISEGDMIMSGIPAVMAPCNKVINMVC